jgi:hypothetical protein
LTVPGTGNVVRQVHGTFDLAAATRRAGYRPATGHLEDSHA